MERLTLQKTLLIIANQTAMNFHSEAILTIARYTNNYQHIKAIQAIITLQTYYGELTAELSKIREQVKNNIMSRLNDEELKAINKVL